MFRTSINRICTSTAAPFSNVQPHAPKIAFRHGPNAADGSKLSALPLETAPSIPAAVAAYKPTAGRAPALEEWQVPARYQRLPLEPSEIEAINRTKKRAKNGVLRHPALHAGPGRRDAVHHNSLLPVSQMGGCI